MRVFLLFTAFFVVTASTVWFDERKNSMIAPYSSNTLYDAGFYVVVVVSVEYAE